MLNTLPARTTAFLYSAFSSPVASPGSTVLIQAMVRSSGGELLAEVNHHRTGAEPASLHASDEEPSYQPDAAHRHGKPGQAQPNRQAAQESEQRHGRVSEPALLTALLLPHVELPEGRQVHAHEGDERTGIEDFAAYFVASAIAVQHQGEHEREDSDEGNVDHRRVTAGIEVGKDAVRKHFVAAHAKEDARRAYLARKSTAEARDDEHQPHRVVEQHPTHAPAYVHEGGIGIGEARTGSRRMAARPVLRPDALREITLGSAEE